MREKLEYLIVNKGPRGVLTVVLCGFYIYKHAPTVLTRTIVLYLSKITMSVYFEQ